MNKHSAVTVLALNRDGSRSGGSRAPYPGTGAPTSREQSGRSMRGEAAPKPLFSSFFFSLPLFGFHPIHSPPSPSSLSSSLFLRIFVALSVEPPLPLSAFCHLPPHFRNLWTPQRKRPATVAARRCAVCAANGKPVTVVNRLLTAYEHISAHASTPDGSSRGRPATQICLCHKSGHRGSATVIGRRTHAECRATVPASWRRDHDSATWTSARVER